MKKLHLVLSITSLLLVFNSSTLKVNAETAEENGYAWVKVDKITEGKEYILALSNGTTTTKSYLPSKYSGSLNKSTKLSDDFNNLLELPNNTFTEATLVAEKGSDSGYYYLKGNNANKPYLYIYEYAEGYSSTGDYYAEQAISDHKIEFQYDATNHALKTKGYYFYNGRADTYTYKTDKNLFISTIGYSTLTVSTSASGGKLFLYEKQDQSAAKAYKVTFDGNGGSGEQVGDEILEGDTYTLPECQFERKGYVFVSWSDGKNNYLPGDTCTITAETTFTAVWRELETYTLTFHKKDGSVLNTISVKENESTYVSQAYKEEGYELKGWTKTEGSDVIDLKVGDRKVFTQNEDYYPVLTPIIHDTKPAISIRLGEKAGLRFKWTLPKEQIEGTLGSTSPLSSYTYGVAVVKTSALKNTTAGPLSSLINSYNIKDLSLENPTWSYSGTDDFGVTKTLTIGNIVANNVDINEKGVTFAGVLTGFNNFPETTEEEISNKKDWYNRQFTAVGYVYANNTFHFTAQSMSSKDSTKVGFSYMDAVNEYLANPEMYQLSTDIISQLNDIKTKYSL